ncbi:uncharacterized protein LOC115621973 [Scaptodrosophila lebanonensis]|uniref:Uncharacterized protein LOC115621973 n=1 Tax=Drosophila lebanonensis TaxID=7225 RepID=A0A6J2T967_DROLE|nr:uncharacterized protein LOC115621973 [Scaptodrosophila lebanonensis]
MLSLDGLIFSISLLHFSAIASSDLLRVSPDELQNFKQCVRDAKRPRLSECLGRSALNFIQRFDERENVSFVEDFVAVKSENAAARSLVNVLDTDPVDFRGILENAGAVMGQRSLEWHMDGIYPGLMFKIGPTADANSVAEFVLDNGVQDERQFGYEEPTTGRLLAKQYLLPFLLGLKFNLVALVPLLFAGICLLLKKSLFLVKLAIYVSSFLGLGGVVSSLGSFGGGFGGLGGLGGLGGFGGIGGGLGVGIPGHRPIGHFPGKTSVYGHYDELHYQHDVNDAPQPYKRNDRKMRFEQPREASGAELKRHTEDRFYDFENQRHQPNKMASSMEDKTVISNAFVHGFQNSPATMNGWQAVDVWHCLGAEAERILDAAANDNSTWHVSEFLSVEPQPVAEIGAQRGARADRNDSVGEKLIHLVQRRALRMHVPRETISNAIDDFGSDLGLDQGRKKKDKDKHMAMMGGMIMLATLAQMFLGKVILIAGSAFVMAKIALLISLLGSLKKGSSGQTGSTDHVIVTSAGSSHGGGGHSHESGWHRSMPTNDYSSAHMELIEEPAETAIEMPTAHGHAYYAYQPSTSAELFQRRQTTIAHSKNKGAATSAFL